MNPLFRNPENAWKKFPEEEYNALDSFCKDYMHFLNEAKTERKTVDFAVKKLQEDGFVELKSVKTWKPGLKVYHIYKHKCLVCGILGEESALHGVRFAIGHGDVPRLDLKPQVFREDEQFAMAETHYYGGIKKYQWLSQPLALHGIIFKKDGTSVSLCIGENEEDPVLIIPDLLPHLAQNAQNSKSIAEAFPGEALDIIMGSRPLIGEEKEAVKAYVMDLLNKKYGIEETDFLSAEIEIVPANKARSVGLDSSMIGAYGQDDRVGCYTSFRALMDLNAIPQKSYFAVFVDKEETGSVGNTGMNSAFIDYIMASLLEIAQPQFTRVQEFEAWEKTKVLSVDVSASMCPIWKSVHEATNAARFGYGISVNKYTGARGKSGTSDASAETMNWVRQCFKNVPWQPSAMGKVDEGGGGTIAYIIAMRGADVIDVGVPVAGMHSLFELTSKLDVYTLYKGIKDFALMQD